jgi:DNA replication and repair protein RecF
MEVKALELVNFRNWLSVNIDFVPEGVTFVVGNNGQGKTNLVEGVFFALRARSFRAPTRDVLLGDQSSFFRVKATVQDGTREFDIDTAFYRSSDFTYLLNSKSLRSIHNLTNLFPVVVFQPEDLTLIKGAPSLRRDLLDDLISVLGGKGSFVVANYSRALSQRNALLRQSQGRLSPSISDTLAVWNERIAVLGEELALLRESLVVEMSHWIVDAYSKVATESLDLSLSYKRSWEGELREALEMSIEQDLRRLTTLVGPHRDELEIFSGAQLARHQASQGEVRAIAVSIRLATALLISQETGRKK